MEEIQRLVGARLRMYRKAKGFTLEDLSRKVYKSKSILSKYELGESIVDIATLCDLADALEIDIRLLLDRPLPHSQQGISRRYGIFVNQGLYLYMLVRNKTYKLIKSYLSFADDSEGQISAILYMNTPDLSDYTKCAEIYTGNLVCFPTNAVIQLSNHLAPEDHTTIFAGIHMNQPSSCYGVFMQNGYTSSDPGCLKVILSKSLLNEDDRLYNQLLLTTNDSAYRRRTKIFGIHSGVIHEKINPSD